MLFGRGAGETLGWGYNVSFGHRVDTLSLTGALLLEPTDDLAGAGLREGVEEIPTLLNGEKGTTCLEVIELLHGSKAVKNTDY